MIVLWIIVAVAGFAVMLVAARRAATSAAQLAAGSSIPPVIIGMTLLAIGTDLPEIANSVAAASWGHGDLLVGDAFGSAATQVTLVLGLFPFFARRIEITGRTVSLLGIVSMVSLALGAVLVADGLITRLDGLLLLGAWIVGSVVVYRQEPHVVQLELVEERVRRAPLIGSTLLALVFVGAGATAAVFALVEIADTFGVPEFLISFFAASIGTSMPELVFDITALRRGEAGLALGDIFGSSFIDATLAVSAGTLLFPVDVTAHLAVRGALSALVAIAIATLLLGRARFHDRRSGAVLLVTYAAFYLVLV